MSKVQWWNDDYLKKAQDIQSKPSAPVPLHPPQISNKFTLDST
jgi:hypothetical protein